MKTFNKFLSIALVFLALPTYSFSRDQIGHWSLAAISCRSGKPPSPAFDPKTRYDLIFYGNSLFENPIIAPGTWMVFRGSYSSSASGFCLHATEKMEALKAPAPHEYQRCFNSKLWNKNLIVTFTSEGSDDNCPQGDQILFRFVPMQ